jgi:hypothetical protein
MRATPNPLVDLLLELAAEREAALERRRRRGIGSKGMNSRKARATKQSHRAAGEAACRSGSQLRGQAIRQKSPAKTKTVRPGTRRLV